MISRASAADLSDEAAMEVDAAGSIQIYGLVEALGSDARIEMTADGIIVIDGLVHADGKVILEGGNDTDIGVGLIVRPDVFKTDENGNLIDVDGNLTDADGFLVNADGEYLDADGNVTTDENAYTIGGNPIRLSGGTVDAVGENGSIILKYKTLEEFDRVRDLLIGED